MDQLVPSLSDPSWRQVVDQLPVGIAILDEKLCVVAANRPFTTLTESAEVIGQNIQDLFPQLSMRLASTLQIVLQTREPIVDLEIATPNQRFAVSSFRISSGIALSIRPALSRSSDSTVQHREAVLRAIFDQAAVGMLILDWKGAGFKTNHALRSMLGYSEKELADLGIQGITHPEDFNRDLAEFQKLMAGAIDHYHLEKRYLRKDGSVMWGRLFVSAARGEQGEPMLLIAMIEDVTERRRSEQEREAMIGALEEALQIREVFLSVASHELKTPLTSLKINLQFTRSRLEAWSGECARLDAAIRQVDRLTTLVDRLLDVSRVAATGLKLERERLDLVEIAREMVARFLPEAQLAKSSIQFVASDAVWVSADRLRMEQVVSNLLANAIKFAPGTQIEVNLRREGELALMTVRDRGIGIDPTDQARIFARFERVASAVRYGGLGLGLYISREIVEAHGGRITVESRLGQGARFCVELPLLYS